MASTCGACSAVTTDELHLCKPCTRSLGEELISVSWLIRDLREVMFTRQVRFSDQQSTARSRETPLPYDERASAMALELDATLRHWALEINPSGHDLPIETDKVALWLAGNLPRIRGNPEAGAVHRALVEVVRKARDIIDRPPDRIGFGMCESEVDPRTGHPQDRCTEYLYARPGAREIRCRRCGSVFDVASRKDWMLTYVRGMVGTASEVSIYLRMVGITVSGDAIRALHNRSRLTSAGTGPSRSRNGEDVTLFRFSDVIDAMSQRYQRKPKPCTSGK